MSINRTCAISSWISFLISADIVRRDSFTFCAVARADKGQHERLARVAHASRVLVSVSRRKRLTVFPSAPARRRFFGSAHRHGADPTTDAGAIDRRKWARRCAPALPVARERDLFHLSKHT